jgi:hypothetical protein
MCGDLIMDWMQFTVFIVSIVGLFFWNRSESRSDIRHMDAKLEATRELVRAIYDETKDFHNRLCDIERGNRK